MYGNVLPYIKRLMNRISSERDRENMFLFNLSYFIHPEIRKHGKIYDTVHSSCYFSALVWLIKTFHSGETPNGSFISTSSPPTTLLAGFIKKHGL